MRGFALFASVTLPNVTIIKSREHCRPCFRFRKHPVRLLRGDKACAPGECIDE
jgi:hypothetical protein